MRRLTEYYSFSKQTLQFVETFANNIAAFATYQDLFKAIGMPEVQLHTMRNGYGVPVVDIIPKIKTPTETFVVHLPMNNSLDANQRYLLASLALAFPKARIIGFGNPSGAPYNFREQNLSALDKFKIAFTNHLRPLVAAELGYLEAHNITNAQYIGYSFGAHKALIAAKYAKQEGVKSILAIDPVIHPRRPSRLIADFKATFQPMGEYVNRTNLKTYHAARRDASREVHFDQGIKRPISIAIGLLLARVNVLKLLKIVLKTHPKLQSTVAWGSKSELGDDVYTQTQLQRIGDELGGRHVIPLRLEGQKHAFANDIFLYVAIVRQSLADFKPHL